MTLLRSCNAFDSSSENYDEPIDCKGACSILPYNPSTKVLYNWMKKGVTNNFTKEHVILQSGSVGGRLFTTRRWLNQFNELISRR